MNESLLNRSTIFFLVVMMALTVGLALLAPPPTIGAAPCDDVPTDVPAEVYERMFQQCWEDHSR